MLSRIQLLAISLLLTIAVGAEAGALKKSSDALRQADTNKVVQSIEKKADSMDKQVSGVEKAVKKVELESNQGHAINIAKGQELASNLHKDQLSTDDNIAKMKASVHAAAMIKKSAIAHSSQLPSAEGSAKPESKASADSNGQRGRTVTIHDPAWFKMGPYAIMALLTAIFCTFCYCACSSRPTAMSGKYDMH